MPCLSSLIHLATAVLVLVPLLSASPTDSPRQYVLELSQINEWKDCSLKQRSKLEKDFEDVIKLAKYAHGNIQKDHVA